MSRTWLNSQARNSFGTAQRGNKHRGRGRPRCILAVRPLEDRTLLNFGLPAVLQAFDGGAGQMVNQSASIVGQALGINVPLVTQSIADAVGAVADFQAPFQTQLATNDTWATVQSILTGAGFQIQYPTTATFNGAADTNGDLLRVSYTKSWTPTPLFTASGNTGFSYLDAGGGGLAGGINAQVQNVSFGTVLGVDVPSGSSVPVFYISSASALSANNLSASGTLAGNLSINQLGNVDAAITASFGVNPASLGLANVHGDGKVRVGDFANSGTVTSNVTGNVALTANLTAHLSFLPDLKWSPTLNGTIDSAGFHTGTVNLNPPSPQSVLSNFASSFFHLGAGFPALGSLASSLNQPLPLINESIAQLTGLDNVLPNLPNGGNLTAGGYSIPLGPGTLTINATPAAITALVQGNATDLMSWTASGNFPLASFQTEIPIWSLGVPDVVSAEIDAIFGINASFNYNVGFGIDTHGCWLQAGTPQNPNLSLTFGLNAGLQGQVEVLGFPLAEAGGTIGFAVTPYVYLKAPPTATNPDHTDRIYLSDLQAFGGNPMTDFVDALGAGIKGDLTGNAFASIDLFFFSMSWQWGIDIPVFNFHADPTWPSGNGGIGALSPWPAPDGGVLTFNGHSAGDTLKISPISNGTFTVRWAGVPGSDGRVGDPYTYSASQVSKIQFIAANSTGPNQFNAHGCTIPVYVKDTASSTNDIIQGGDGGNTLLGGSGNDTLIGGLGSDSLVAGNGTNLLIAGDGGTAAQPTTVQAGNGTDTIYGGAGHDSLLGGSGNDSIYAGSGPSIIHGGSGTYFINGGTGNDTIYGDTGAAGSVIHAGGGNCTIYASSNGSLIYGDTGQDIIYGGLAADTIHAGTGGNNVVYGGGGNDLIYGGGNGDKLYGGTWPGETGASDGNVMIYGGAGSETLYGGSGDGSGTSANYLVAGPGNDVLYGDTAGYTDSNGVRHGNTLIGGTGNDTLYAGAGGDYLTAGTGQDALYGGPGNDSIQLQFSPTGQLQDAVSGGAGLDTLVLRPTGFGGQAPNPDQLASAVADASSTTITVTNAAAITSTVPQAGSDYIIQIDNEQMLVTAIAGNTLTVERGYNGTTATPHDANAFVLLDPAPLPSTQPDYKMYFNTVPGATNQYQATLSNLDTGTFVGQVGIALPADVEEIALEGGPGNNLIQVDPSVTRNMFLYGGPGHNTLMAGSGSDTLVGGPGSSVLYGGSGDDHLYGGDMPAMDQQPQLDHYGQVTSHTQSPGHNTLIAGTGNDELYAQNDTMHPGAGGDVLLGGPATLQNGQFVFTAGVNAGRDVLAGGSGTDLLIAGPGGPGAILYAGTGKDILVADNNGGDMLEGGSSTANDLLIGGDLDNLIFGGAGNDTLVGGTGLDTLQAGGGNDVLCTGTGNDTVYAASWAEAVSVAAADHVLLTPPPSLTSNNPKQQFVQLHDRLDSLGQQITNLESLQQTGNLTSGSKIISGLAITYDNILQAGLVVGETVTGVGIPAGTTITAITGTDTITISNSATVSASGADLTFGQGLTPALQSELLTLLNQDAFTAKELIIVDALLGANVFPYELIAGVGTDQLYGSSQVATEFIGDPLVAPATQTTYYNYQYQFNDTLQGGNGENILMFQGDSTAAQSIALQHVVVSGQDAVNVTIPAQNNGQPMTVGKIGHISGIQVLGLQLGAGDDNVMANFGTWAGLALLVQCGSGSDTVDATGMQGALETLLGGSGNDTVKISPLFATGSQFSGGTGNSTLLIQAPPGNDTITVTSQQFQVIYPGGQTPLITPPTGFSQLDLIGDPGPGNDNFATDGSIANVVVQGGGGENTFQVGPGNDTIIGGPSTNALTIQFDNNGDTVHLAQHLSTITMTGTVSGSATNMTSVTVLDGPGNETNTDVVDALRMDDIPVTFSPDASDKFIQPLAVNRQAQATHFSVTTTRSTDLNGQALQVTVTPLDANGNPAVGYRGTIHFKSNDPSAVLPSDCTFSGSDMVEDPNGQATGIQHTFQFALFTPGVQTLRVTDTQDTTLTGNATAATMISLPNANSLPQCVTYDKFNGNMWFSEGGADAIGSLSPGGRLAEYGPAPGGQIDQVLTVGQHGELWFTEYWGSPGNTSFELESFDPVTQQFQERAALPINSSPGGLVLDPDNDHLWITYRNLPGYLGLYSISHNQLINVGGLSGNGRCITVGPDGNVWFTEDNGKIGTATQNGLLHEWPLNPNCYPFRIVADKADNALWFTELDANKIGEITTSGSITEYSVPTADSQPFDVTMGPDGNIWFTENTVSQVGAISRTGQFLGEFAVSAGKIITQPTSTVNWLGFNNAGTLWASDYNAGAVWAISPTLSVPASATPPIVTTVAGDPLARTLFGLDSQGNLRRYDPLTGWLTINPPNTTVAQFGRDPNGDILYALGTDGHVYRSFDRGVDWTVNSGFGGLISIAVAQSAPPGPPLAVYALSSNGNLYESTDSTDTGQTWTSVLSSVASFALDTSDNTLLYSPISTSILGANEGEFSGTLTVAGFKDQDTTGPNSAYTATIQWGDGQTSSGTVIGNGQGTFQVWGSHVYAEEGSYTITVTIQDVANGSVSAALVTTRTCTVTDAPLALAVPGTSDNLIGQAGWTGSGYVPVTHGVIDGQSDPGTGAIESADHALSLPAGASFSITFDALAMAASDAVPSAGSLLGLGDGLVYWTQDGTAARPQWAFDAAALTGNANDTTSPGSLSAAAFDHWITLGIVVDAVNNLIYGTWYLGNGVSGQTAAFTVTADQIKELTSLFVTEDYSHHTVYLGAEYRNITLNVGGTITGFYPGSSGAQLTPPQAVAGAPTGTVTVASFSDEDPRAAAGDYTATINWGDGQSSAGTIIANPDGTFSVQGGHTYAAEGTNLPFSVQIQDGGGATFSANATIAVADAPLDLALPGTGPNLVGQAGWTGSGVVPVTHGVIDGQSDPGTGSLETAAHLLSLPADASFSVTFDALAMYASDAVPSANSLLGLGNGLVYWTQDATATRPQWIFDATALTGHPTDTSSPGALSAAAFDRWITLGIVVDAVHGQVYGTYDLGNGVSGHASPFTVTAQQIAELTSLFVTEDYSHHTAYLGAEYRNITISVGATQTFLYPGTKGAQLTPPKPVAGQSTGTISVATFQDEDPNGAVGDYSATITWGDGSSSPGTIVDNGNGTFSVQGSHTYAAEEAASQLNFGVQITDVGGATLDASATIDLTPIAAISAPTDGYQGVQGQTRTFLLTTTGTGPDDENPGFTYTVNWGDGTSSSLPPSIDDGYGLLVSHVFKTAGSNTISYTITVCATDPAGTTGPAASETLTIHVVEQQGNVLAVGGATTGTTTWTFTQTGPTSLTVKEGSKTLGTYSGSTAVELFGQTGGTNKVIVSGGSGNDVFSVSGQAATMNAFTFAGISGSGTAAIAGWTFNGQGGNNTLLGPNAATTWTLSKANGGSLASAPAMATVAFSLVQNLVGGTAGNVFKFTSTAATFTTINGGGPDSWLDYSAFPSTAPVRVDLTQGSATNVHGGAAGSISNIQNLRGGAGNDTLIGNGGNILVGGGGNDILTDAYAGSSAVGGSLLIGGLGSDTLTAGAAGDILISGTTSYDTKNANLQDILNYWNSHTHSAAFAALHGTGVGATHSKLIWLNTVKDDSAPDVLMGSAAVDWFFAGVGDSSTSAQHGFDYLNNGLA